MTAESNTTNPTPAPEVSEGSVAPATPAAAETTPADHGVAVDASAPAPAAEIPQETGDSIPASADADSWQSMTLFPTHAEKGLVASTTTADSYLPILIFLVIAGVMALVMIVLPMLITRQKPDKEKLSAYECGFDSYGDARGKFDVRFYLVAILFIIFDLEVAFLFPWAVSLGTIGVFGFWSMMIFLGVLTVGFIYEWKKGALDWE